MTEKLETEAIKQVIEDYIAVTMNLQKALDDIQAVGIDLSEPLRETIWAVSDKYSALIEVLIGSRTGVLEWFAWENECGKRELTAKVNGEDKPIKTVDDLIWLITMDIHHTHNDKNRPSSQN